MTQIVEILEYLKKYPVFNSTTIKNKLDKSSEYTNLFVYRLIKKGLVCRIEKSKYTVFKDPFLIASRIVWPSYISCWNGLKYHNLTEQVPHDISVIVANNKKLIKIQNTQINFIKIKTRNFFGYEKVKYNGFDIFIADAEKSIIDSALLRKVSLSELQEIIIDNIQHIKISKFLSYLKKIGNKSLIKRFGYIFEKAGKDYYNKLRKYVDAAYILLDYSKKPIGKKNKKWRLIIND